jgi:hypothetical protein
MSFSQSVEWEIANIGLPMGIQKNKAGNAVRSYDRGFTLGSEVRLNLLEKKISTGLQFAFTGWNRTSPQGSYINHQNPFIFSVVGDYNFLNVHRRIVPFAGIGLGYSIVRSWLYMDSDTEDYLTLASHFACSPRVGVEFFKRIRLTAEYRYIGNRNNFFNVKLGFVIGS